MYRIEFRHQRDTQWHLAQDGFESLDAAQEYYNNNYGCNSYSTRSRDYVIRLVDEDEYVYIQDLPAPRWSWANIDYKQIDWNLPPEEIGEKRHMINVGIRRIGGKLTLLVNAKEFHEELDKIGVQHNNTEYLDQPASAAAVAGANFQISPKVLLRRDYKEVDIPDPNSAESKKISVTGAFDLSGIWSNPPSFEQLKKLCNSAEPVARKILEHYQPIDISVEIHKKIVK